MHVSGSNLIQSQPPDTHFELKALLNEEAIVFFPVSRQHRDVHVHGLSYEDDYKGNALAAMVKPGVIEVRFHRDFSDERVRGIWLQIQNDPAAAFLRDWKITYQGRQLN